MQIGNGGGGETAVVGGATAITTVGIVGASQSSQAGPIIAGVVAFVVALITWYATDKRQSKALAAEEQRQAKALDAEQRRHEATLAAENERWRRNLEAENERHSERLLHERRLANLDETRRVMDAVLEGSFALLSKVLELEARAEAIQESTAPGEAPTDADWEFVGERENETIKLWDQLFGPRQAFAVRVGREHVVNAAYHDLARAATKFADVVPFDRAVPIAEQIAELIAARNAYDKSLEALIDRMHEILEPE